MASFLFYFSAYIFGLAITYMALALTQKAQPALLYLVPTTLGSVTLLSLLRREATLFFTNKQKVKVSLWQSLDDTHFARIQSQIMTIGLTKNAVQCQGHWND